MSTIETCQQQHFASDSNAFDTSEKTYTLWKCLFTAKIAELQIWSAPLWSKYVGNTRKILKLQGQRFSAAGAHIASWWRHQMEAYSALLTLCEGNPPVTGGFPSQKPVTRSFDVFVDLGLNKRFSKQTIRRWFETPWRSLWRHCSVLMF